MNDTLQEGQDAFYKAVPREAFDHLGELSELERERWWSGFIISAISACGLSVGSEMASLIASAAIDLENDVHADDSGEVK